MRVLVMAAGQGTRFGGKSKAFLPVLNEPLIVRTIRQLREYGLGPIYIVVGHKAELFLTLQHVLLIPNPEYASGDNAQGLKVALDTIGFEDTLILDADLVFSDGALEPLLESYSAHKDPVSLVDLSFNDPEAMKLVINNDRIVEYSKEKGVGAEVCTLVTEPVLRAIYPDLEHIRWWGVGVGKGKLTPRIATLSSEAKWIEIDTPEDHVLAEKLFSKS